ncbi:MAG: hypothetical protein ACRDJ9_23375, partial [Dehalococcoidia bacterium]
NLGVPLVHSEAGGAGGGHTQITPEGRDLLRRYAEFQRRTEAAVRQAYVDAFAKDAGIAGRAGAEQP